MYFGDKPAKKLIKYGKNFKRFHVPVNLLKEISTTLKSARYNGRRVRIWDGTIKKVEISLITNDPEDYVLKLN